MIKLFAVLCTFLEKSWDKIDYWLCIHLHWCVRLWWHALWVRRNESHPSLDSDYPALFDVICFRRRLLRVWINISRGRPIPTKEDRLKELLRLRNLEDRLYKKYTDSLVRRQYIARRRDENPMLF